jgi:spore coat protein JB
MLQDGNFFFRERLNEQANFNKFIKGELKNMIPSEAESTSLLNELQALDFALVELTLYLDTHPFDVNAIKQHNDLAEQRHVTRTKLEDQSGALKNERWNLAPWPWQI